MSPEVVSSLMIGFFALEALLSIAKVDSNIYITRGSAVLSVIVCVLLILGTLNLLHA